MHLLEPIRTCIDEMVRSTGSGLKSMVLDDFTKGVISAGYSRSELLLREVYLFECIDTLFETPERLCNLKCIIVLRPTKENVESLCRELNRPHYRTYHIYFTSRIGSNLLQRVAEADGLEVVRVIKTMAMDFQAVNPFLFTLKLSNKTFDLKKISWLPEGLKRASEGLSSALIALKIHPLIRYQTQSQLCKNLAEKVGNIITNESLTNKTWRKAAPFDVNSLLLILDRRSDLLTPLVNKWNYYSIINEQFEIVNNRIDLSNVPNRQPKDPKEMLITIENDMFFKENYYKNYGELGPIFREAIDDLKDFSKTQEKVETMEDMKRFIDEYPEAKRYTSNLQNHVFLMSELTRIVTENNLIAISECEQQLACGSGSQSEILKLIRQYVGSSSTRAIDAIRLVSIYSVCRPDESDLKNLIKLLKTRPDVTSDDVEFIRQLREFASSKPTNPLDETVQQVTRMIVQGVKGVDNVLTQYKPSLTKIFDELRKGNKLKESDFAFQGERDREAIPKKIIVFFVGGVTYDEALVADQVNRSQISYLQIIVGGTSIHNFKSFKDEVRSAILQSENSD